MVLGHRRERINGVKPGNWLVLEKWMDRNEPFVIALPKMTKFDDIARMALWPESTPREETALRTRDAISLGDFALSPPLNSLNSCGILSAVFLPATGISGCVGYLYRAFAVRAWGDGP